MRILGIDPGLGRVGFGLLEIVSSLENIGAVGSGGYVGQTYGPCQWGMIATSKDKSDSARLQEIYEDLQGVLTALKPDAVAVERLFYFRNATTMVPVSQARGVILLCLEQFGLPLYEYTPMQVKQAITGYGKAEKAEVQDMLVQLLSLEKKPTPDDAADALAMAVCHYHHVGRFQNVQATTA